MSKKKLTAIDLFSGCGGLSLGLRNADFSVLAAIEIDDLAAETYRVNHKGTNLIQEDIRKIDPTKLRERLGLKRGELDLLAGCPPCQGFSTLRTNKKTVAVKDNRNNLMFRFLDFIEEFQPKAVMMENVPGLSKGNRIKRFVQKLEALGYFVNHNVLNVADYAVPQRRKRFILMASKFGMVDFAKPTRKKVTVRSVIGSLENPLKSSDNVHNHGEHRTTKIMKMISHIPKDGGSRSALPRNLQMDCHKRTTGFCDVFGRMKWDDVAPTITGGCVNPSKGRFLHPSENRTITLREAAILQGFPRNYYFSMRRGKTGASLMIGNALPPEFIRRHAEEIKRVLSKR